MTGPVGAAPPPDGFGLPGGQPAGARWGSPAPPPVYLRVAFHNVTSIDVHICLSGSEIIQVVPVDGLISVSRNDQEDYVLYNPTPAAQSIPMLPRYVAILFPYDAHRPGFSHPSTTFVQKIIIKVPLRLLT
ncbi:MAG: hypothetical protein A3G57_01450 [Candidatus Andersenbacteria bacterium RIFCSPLOWO2_12_FULL_45_8]|nr:MAG: hypothetical protein A3B76_01780 [Candidatus Andersenbacteria bacterium RIFCSPHIGHO2_02_FULL_46_16]OGY36897.1 MAG: hypothetical protein A3I08_05720 [Candidatus Andersenbacteria bacterium RIFCSPLOWO2_02_FULL_46_11]OGY40644.1 MAG: hypothetical protein A3G57_01450 [Candidatus Andersenbacteria bacterium RIFCSPLOWO2_12_FULL_45_8]